MIQAATKEDNLKTLSLCDDVKIRLEELELLLKNTVNQGLSDKFEDYSQQLTNWIEEIEFNITNRI